MMQGQFMPYQGPADHMPSYGGASMKESDFIARDSLVSDQNGEFGSGHDSKKGSHSMKAAAASRGKTSGSTDKNRKKKPIQKNFTTKQFMNLTMTQVYQGRDREVNPLFKKQRSAFQNFMTSSGNRPVSPQTSVVG